MAGSCFQAASMCSKTLAAQSQPACRNTTHPSPPAGKVIQLWREKYPKDPHPSSPWPGQPPPPPAPHFAAPVLLPTGCSPLHYLARTNLGWLAAAITWAEVGQGGRGGGMCMPCLGARGWTCLCGRQPCVRRLSSS